LLTPELAQNDLEPLNSLDGTLGLIPDEPVILPRGVFKDIENALNLGGDLHDIAEVL
jgi:hypothetical protein